jgi:hypothetical protein
MPSSYAPPTKRNTVFFPLLLQLNFSKRRSMAQKKPRIAQGLKTKQAALRATCVLVVWEALTPMLSIVCLFVTKIA